MRWFVLLLSLCLFSSKLYAQFFTPRKAVCQAKDSSRGQGQLEADLKSHQIRVQFAGFPLESIFDRDLYCGLPQPEMPVSCPYVSLSGPAEFVQDLSCGLNLGDNAPYLVTHGRLQLNQTLANGFLECASLANTSYSLELTACRFE